MFYMFVTCVVFVPSGLFFGMLARAKGLTGDDRSLGRAHGHFTWPSQPGTGLERSATDGMTTETCEG